MNTLYVALICIAAGPFSAAIKQKTPEPPKDDWQIVKVDSTTIELPVPATQEFARVAPANYKTPVPTKRVAIPCPYHGYSCGMSAITEDLLGHLQSVHNITLEQANLLGRDKWQSLHDNLHWEQETAERKELFLNPKPAVQTKTASSGCANGRCPTTNYNSITRYRNMFR